MIRGRKYDPGIGGGSVGEAPTIGRDHGWEMTQAGPTAHAPGVTTIEPKPASPPAAPTPEPAALAVRPASGNPQGLAARIAEIERRLEGLGHAAQHALAAVARTNGLVEDLTEACQRLSEVAIPLNDAGPGADAEAENSVAATAAPGPAATPSHEQTAPHRGQPGTEPPLTDGVAGAGSPSTVAPTVAPTLAPTLAHWGALTEPRALRQAREPSKSRLAALTPRQLDVLLQLRQAKSNREIARALNLAEGTVKVHVTGILKAFGVKNRTQATLVAIGAAPCSGALG